jgi:hypothetical protein
MLTASYDFLLLTPPLRVEKKGQGLSRSFVCVRLMLEENLESIFSKCLGKGWLRRRRRRAAEADRVSTIVSGFPVLAPYLEFPIVYAGEEPFRKCTNFFRIATGQAARMVPNRKDSFPSAQ